MGRGSQLDEKGSEEKPLDADDGNEIRDGNMDQLDNGSGYYVF